MAGVSPEKRTWKVRSNAKIEWVTEQLRDAIIAEGSRYHFLDRSTSGELGAAMVASISIDVVWNNISDSTKSAVLVVEDVAEYIHLKFNVAGRDQRKTLRRKQAAS